MSKEYYHTQESVEEYVELAKDVSGAKLIEQLKNVLTAGSSVLEIGSGPGTDWRILKESYQVVGSDNSSEFLKHLHRANPDGEFLELDAVSLSTDQKFEGVYSNKVLHHLTDEELKESVKRQAQILGPNGIICHSFWKGEGTEVFKGMFVNYHNEQTIRSFFDDEFTVLSISDYQEFDPGDSFLLIARRK